jgi:hypothetical protein
MPDAEAEFRAAENAYLIALRESAQDPTNSEKIVAAAAQYQRLEIAYLQMMHGSGRNEE